MKPKEKAKEIIDKFFNTDLISLNQSIQMAEITLDYLMKEAETNLSCEYWFNVKKELKQMQK